MPLNQNTKHVLMRPETDRIFKNLANSHRRLILLLLKHDAVETETDVMVRNGSESKEVETALIHNHLPRLAEAGYVDWDRDSGELSKGPRFDEIEPLLELIENHADELPPNWP